MVILVIIMLVAGIVFGHFIVLFFKCDRTQGKVASRARWESPDDAKSYVDAENLKKEVLLKAHIAGIICLLAFLIASLLL